MYFGGSVFGYIDTNYIFQKCCIVFFVSVFGFCIAAHCYIILPASGEAKLICLKCEPVQHHLSNFY